MKKNLIAIQTAIVCFIAPAVSAELITFDWAAGFQNNIPTTTFFDVDGTGIDVEISFTTFTQGNGANNPASNGGVDGTAGAFLNTGSSSGSMLFDSDVLVSQFYWRPAGAAAGEPVTLVGTLEGVEQWNINTIVPVVGDFVLISDDLQLSSGSLSNPIDSITYSQTSFTNINRLDDLTFSAVIPEPSTYAALAGLLALLFVARRGKCSNHG
ncbi:MAG: PEP-CTERM sorting domain-containing protein [Verrucomicrobiota bacterium]